MKKAKEPVKTVDRRIQKTIKLLFDALVELIIDKGYEAVTIQDIIDKANVGRSTFYSHYESKEQLLFTGDDTFSSSLLQHLQGKGNKQLPIEEKLLMIYEHVGAHHKVSKALLGGKGATPMVDHAETILKHLAEQELKVSSTTTSSRKMLQFKAGALSAALARLLICWIDNDMPFSSEEMRDASMDLLKCS